MNLADRVRFLHEKFGQIVPDKVEKLLTVVLLDEWVRMGKIEQKFTEQDVNFALAEIVEITGRDKSIAVQKPIRDLRKHFLLYFRKDERYMLSQYAEDFIRMMNNEIYRSTKPESLKITFRKTFLLTEDDFESLETFKVWYEDRFLNTTKGKISNVLDALQQDISNRYDELNNVFKQNIDFNEQLNLFLEKFKQIKERFDDINETVHMRNEVISLLKKGSEWFEGEDWLEYDYLRSQIEGFFEYVDYRLDELRLVVDQSVKQINALYKNFEFKRLYKIKLEKFLHLLLEKSVKEKDKIVLPENISIKYLPSFKPFITTIPDTLEVKKKKTEVLEAPSDEEYLQKQRARQKEILYREQRSTYWTSVLKEEMKKNGSIIVDEWFARIMKEDNDIEIAVKVVNNTINQYKFNDQYQIEIGKPSKKEYLNSDLIIWKMKVKSSAS
ncbi:MAG TPA: hypothetical protein VIK89_12225 [Cytophagaceae bacterium]